MTSTDPRRNLPATHELLRAYRAAGGMFDDAAVVPLIQREVSSARMTADQQATRASVSEQIITTLLALERPRLGRVLNGTGVIIHTNLGRALASEEAAQAMALAASSAVPLEIDLASNARGGRMREIEELIFALTGAESALLVNNNAAAMLLALTTIAAGKEVIVSRGEAVEIGGGFRVPDVLAQSGARMIDVGATNRTYTADYARAINAETAAILKVHPSNFSIAGFVHDAAIEELAALANAKGIVLIDDLGSGALIDPALFGVSGERTVRQSLDAGADLVAFSTDKLVGGPQGGIIAGRRRLIERISRHPLARAVRADKVALAGVAETLRHYARGEATTKIPVWRMIATPIDHLRARSRTIRAALPGVGLDEIAVESTIGGGAAPGQTLKSIALSPTAEIASNIENAATQLRLADPGLTCRTADQRLLIDLRTILPEDDEELVGILQGLVQEPSIHPEKPGVETPG